MAGFKTIYSKDGTPLTDIRGAITRSWLLKDVGEAVFFVPTSSPKCRQDYLEYGNYIVIQHDQLPDWVGMIDTPRIWHNGYVEVHAFEPASLLKYRYTPADLTFTGTPGEKFTMLIEAANNQYDTLITAGTVYGLGVSVEEKFSQSIFDHITALCEQYLMEWITRPVIDAYGKLRVHMDFIDRVGVDTQAELQQGKNILYGDSPYEENGVLINHIEAMTEAYDAPSTFYNATISTAYGFRSIRQTFSGVGADALQSLSESFLEISKDPIFSSPLTIVNTGNLYKSIGIGNTLRYKLSNVGFMNGGLGVEKRIRVAGFRLTEANGVCELFTVNV